MRLRLHSVIYQSGSAAPSLEQHYRTLRGAMFHLGQQYIVSAAGRYLAARNGYSRDAQLRC